jgi:hypothetical protein
LPGGWHGPPRPGDRIVACSGPPGAPTPAGTGGQGAASPPAACRTKGPLPHLFSTTARYDLNVDNAGNGIDSLARCNVGPIALRVPIADLKGSGDVVGVYASTERPVTTDAAARGAGGKPVLRKTTEWKQVSRLRNPLINEVVIPRHLKDQGDPQASRTAAAPPRGAGGSRGRPAPVEGAPPTIDAPGRRPMGDPTPRDPRRHR